MSYPYNTTYDYNNILQNLNDSIWRGTQAILNDSNFSTTTNTSITDDYTANNQTIGNVNIGASVTGSLERVGDYDWFKVALVTNQSYIFKLEGNGSSSGLHDPYLELYNSNGLFLVSDDDGGVGLNSQLTYTAIISGTYYVVASEATDSNTGAYVLSSASTTTNTSATVQEHLSSYGVTVQQARDFIVANLSSPVTIYNTCEQYDVTNQMIVEIFDNAYSIDTVKGYFSFNGLNPASLDMFA